MDRIHPLTCCRHRKMHLSHVSRQNSSMRKKNILSFVRLLIFLSLRREVHIKLHNYHCSVEVIIADLFGSSLRHQELLF